MRVLHILLAEVNLGDILLIKHALEQHHVQHELHVVKDGAEALDFVTRIGQPGNPPCPDLILLDMNLPKVDGPQILSEFRKHSECVQTPVIIVSSSDMPKDRARMAEFGIACYFRKPSDLDAFMKLGAVVRQVMEGEAA